jgi:hypothetical protein
MLDKPRDRKPRRHWELLLIIVPASMFACLGSAMFSAAWTGINRDFTEKAANLGAMIFGGSMGLIGFAAIPLAIIAAIVPFSEEELSR